MSLPLIETKLFLPTPRPGRVPRPRLRERLDRGLEARLMLVSAPAGFGKTTLLVDWMASADASVAASPRGAWLALDSRDNDPGRFWTYVVAAVRTAVPGVGEGALGLLEDPQSPVEGALTSLVNELAATDVDLVLLLDDYHVIEAPTVHAGMAFLLAHLPPRVHLVLATRSDPPLPLALLRARGDLVEVRAADLRFTTQEAASYLNEVMGLDLAPADVRALEGRTEGWIAALQLAALSMTGRDDVSGFIAGFTGDDRYVVDYLVEEVLQRLPDDLQDFLLRTSVLDRMNGALCNALTGRTDGRGSLEALERDNLFVVPLDDRRHWYRYHHLFADVLRGRLLDAQPDLVQELHAMAATWHEQEGDIVESIRHSLLGADFVGAAELVESLLPSFRRDRREAIMRGWIEALPSEVLQARPVLGNALAGARMSTGEFDGVDELLDATEDWLASGAQRPGPSTRGAGVDDDEYRRLPGDLAVHRAGIALVRGDVERTLEHARRALDHVGEGGDHLTRGAAFALRGLAAWSGGDLATAHASYAACLVEFERIDHVSDVLACSITLADIEVVQGRLRSAAQTYRSALALADRHHTPVLRGRADMHVGLAARHREADDLDAARLELARSRDLGEQAGLLQDAYRWRLVMAGIREAEGDVEAAIDLLDESERLYVGDFSPPVRPVPAVRARAWARHGHVDAALAWVDRVGLSLDDPLTYLREFEHVTLARVLAADHARRGGTADLSDVVALLDRMLIAATDGGRQGSVVEIQVTRALVLQQQGDGEAAVTALEAALRVAEPEGYVRTFLDEGPPMATLLAAAERRSPTAYVRRLRSALDRVPTRPAPGRTPSRHDMPVETLSSRERDVLRLLGTELNGPEIARELVVSLNTVRTHTKNLYMKLGVTSRRSAVVRGKELDLL
ncbi:LuxR family transcriptional regulator, maltose regulon positive regulatory protein [Nocardioides alpinus]|uniref:Helix-turn-helix transcriptional regulator n=1 Tax=Nocardioides alpinus TaxID=748909 RepID=A0A1I1AU38_9ACTN|nr:LuxR C-terminal-related transcriptional regulator [Nocardioides alpinus]PKH40885.1 helix-turn-helix transcriptional regulator [Nocardioides alpinus]SFB41595.1 LuxR family transcriptional regulator, maltose regulon positive regulatory protein [Nocardioides alpinus]